MEKVRFGLEKGRESGEERLKRIKENLNRLNRELKSKEEIDKDFIRNLKSTLSDLIDLMNHPLWTKERKDIYKKMDELAETANKLLSKVEKYSKDPTIALYRASLDGAMRVIREALKSEN